MQTKLNNSVIREIIPSPAEVAKRSFSRWDRCVLNHIKHAQPFADISINSRQKTCSNMLKEGENTVMDGRPANNSFTGKAAR